MVPFPSWKETSEERVYEYTTTDRSRLIKVSNVTSTTRQDYPRDICVPQLVAAQATDRPDVAAVIEGNRVLSYNELNRRANQLAHHLRGLGVQHNVIVALCVERSIDMVVGLLGILKAGGAYVPLDPAYPDERLTFMMRDAHVPVLVTQRYLAQRLSIQGIELVCLDSDAAVLAEQSTANPCPAVTPEAEDLAYAIYTSGSTGQPKGTLITHDSLLNLVYWHQRAFAVTSSDRATQFASLAFDAAGWELWPYLTIGASVYLPEGETSTSPMLLRDWLMSLGITITFLPTALAEEVMALEWPSQTSLRFLLTGGDTLYSYPPQALPFAVINNYGLTETTVVATSGCVLPVEHPDGPPPIGRPIANTRMYVLNEHLQQVPLGDRGVMYVGGSSLAKGYLNRSELTAERFIPHPFSDEPGALLYNTGDLGRYLPDGQLAFLGRSDHQIKIRGYRIEPGEIVCVLNRYPAVRASVVVAREDTPGDKSLVAYVVPVPDAHMTVSSLQEELGLHLPDYMIPATFVGLEALPLTPNGKVDSAALPIPNMNNLLQDEVLAASNMPVEERLAEIITTLLGIEHVVRDDNFFMLGGHSLLGTQLIARMAEAFDVDVSLRMLFESPTVQQLAALIEQLLIAKVEAMSESEAHRLLSQEYSACPHHTGSHAEERA